MKSLKRMSLPIFVLFFTLAGAAFKFEIACLLLAPGIMSGRDSGGRHLLGLLADRVFWSKHRLSI